jgi:hypothetical protein
MRLQLQTTTSNTLAVNNLNLLPLDYQSLPVKLGSGFCVDLYLHLHYFSFDTVDWCSKEMFTTPYFKRLLTFKFKFLHEQQNT